jgi:uncharacterized membrane protein
MDEEDEFEGVEECVIPAQKFSKWDVLMAFFAMMMGIATAISGFFEVLTIASVAAANKQVQTNEFHEDAALDIETITRG